MDSEAHLARRDNWGRKRLYEYTPRLISFGFYSV